MQPVANAKEVRKSLTQNLGGVKGVNPIAVQRDLTKPLHEEEPYLVQVRKDKFFPTIATIFPFCLFCAVLTCRIDRQEKRQDCKLRRIGMVIPSLIQIEVILLEIVMNLLFKR